MPSKPKTSRRETTVEERVEVWTWYKSDKTISEIGRLTGLPRSTCSDIIKRAKLATGKDKFSSKPRAGAPPKITPKAERRLMRAAWNDTQAPLLALGTPSKSGVKISRRTVRGILKRNGKARRRPRRKPYLSKRHIGLRRKFYYDEKTRNWWLVCWSDECTMEVGYDGRQFWITRAPGEEYLPKNLKPTFKSGRTTISVWGCFMGNERGPLIVLPKGQNMNQQLYTDLVLKPHFIPFYKKMVRKYGSQVVIQEDGAKYHFAPIPTKYKDLKKVKQLNWPPQSPDLAPIENLWKILKDKVSGRRHRIRSAEEMGIAACLEWEKIPVEMLGKLSNSMTNRLRELKQNKFRSIRY
jgi:transposase